MAYPSISIVIPAYNEEKNISPTITRVKDYCTSLAIEYEIIVVDDGSTDATVTSVRTMQSSMQHLLLVCLPLNKGKGYAVRAGFELAQHDCLFFYDADGSTPIEELKKCFDVHTTGYDIVIGSRYLRASTMTRHQPWYRITLGRMGNALIQFLLLPGISDTQCGFKLFSKNVGKKISSLQTIERWGFDMEQLSIARLLGYRICEVPVSWNDCMNRKSRFLPIRDAHRTLHELFIIKWNLLRGAYTLTMKKKSVQ